MAQREIKVGAVSWINAQVSPIWLAAKSTLIEPGWVPKSYMGLLATRNDDPPATIADFRVYEKKEDFRAMMFCHLKVDIDDKTDRVVSVKVVDAFHNPGWTPPFRAFRLTDSYPTALFASSDAWSFTAYAGEASPLSVVNTRARHANSTIGPLSPTEQVLVNGMIKFRAGSHTDSIGVEKVGAPYHVPWVWCEMLLTYSNKQLKLRGRGSVFPTHAWYLNGQQKKRVNEVGDDHFPYLRKHLTGPIPVVKPTSVMPYVPHMSLPGISYETWTIDTQQLKLWPVLTAGAPASGAQVSLAADAGLKTPMDQHQYTAAGNPVFEQTVPLP